MVRVPLYLHPQAARRSSSTLAWRPGWRGTGQQPIRPIGVGNYTGRIAGVPLTGGQAQGIIPGWAAASGALLSPGAFADIFDFRVPFNGTFTFHWTVALSGTVGAGDANNFGFFKNFSLVTPSVNAGAAGTYPQAPLTLAIAAGDDVGIGTIGAGTAGSLYGASIDAGSNPLTLQAGPQGLGTTWYPVSVTLSTETGVLDTSTALVYLGPSATPATLQASVFSGNGTASLAIPSMQPGQTIIVTWTGGKGGDIAAFNITGTMDALSTG